MKRSTKVIGLLALTSTIAFLYRSSRESDKDFNHIDGLDVNINADKLIDGGSLFINEKFRGPVKKIAKRFVNGVMLGRG